MATHFHIFWDDLTCILKVDHMTQSPQEGWKIQKPSIHRRSSFLGISVERWWLRPFVVSCGSCKASAGGVGRSAAMIWLGQGWTKSTRRAWPWCGQIVADNGKRLVESTGWGDQPCKTCLLYSSRWGFLCRDPRSALVPKAHPLHVAQFVKFHTKRHRAMIEHNAPLPPVMRASLLVVQFARQMPVVVFGHVPIVVNIMTRALSML